MYTFEKKPVNGAQNQRQLTGSLRLMDFMAAYKDEI